MYPSDTTQTYLKKRNVVLATARSRTVPSLPKGGGVDKDKYEGDESELIEAARVAEAILQECTSDGGRGSFSNGSAARDRDPVFSSNRSGESGGHTLAGTESVPTHS